MIFRPSMTSMADSKYQVDYHHSGVIGITMLSSSVSHRVLPMCRVHAALAVVRKRVRIRWYRRWCLDLHPLAGCTRVSPGNHPPPPEFAPPILDDNAEWDKHPRDGYFKLRSPISISAVSVQDLCPVMIDRRESLPHPPRFQDKPYKAQ